MTGQTRHIQWQLHLSILPIYFKLVAEQGGMSSATSTALWGYTISIATFIVAMIAPILGNIADYKGK